LKNTVAELQAAYDKVAADAAVKSDEVTQLDLKIANETKAWETKLLENDKVYQTKINEKMSEINQAVADLEASKKLFEEQQALKIVALAKYEQMTIEWLAKKEEMKGQIKSLQDQFTVTEEKITSINA